MVGLLRSEGIFAVGAAATVAPTLANFQTPIINSDAISSTAANATNIVAGVPHLVILQWRRSSSAAITHSHTLGGASITGFVDTAPAQNDPGIWMGTITPGSGGTLSLALNTGNAWSAMVASVVQVDGFGALGTPAAPTGVSNASSSAAAYVTTVANALIIGAICAQNGTLAHTPDATVPTVEVLDQSSGGSGTADVTAFAGTIAAETAGSYTFGSSWGSAQDFARAVVEVQPA